MGTFNTQKILAADPAMIPEIASKIESYFKAEGYDVKNLALANGAAEVSITKGNIFRVVLGLKTALKVSLTPQGNCLVFDASVGIWGLQAIPTIISMLFFWPVLITQIWGVVQQSKLDDKALEIAENVIDGKKV